MNILWLKWKDIQNPRAGGAELVGHELASRLAAGGHNLICLTASFPGAKPDEARDGYRVIRAGGRLGVYWRSFRYYRKHLQQWPDVIIDEMNTIPFFSRYYAQQATFLFVHQLCRKVWFWQLPRLAGLAGYMAELLWLRMLSGLPVITVSESTKQDLIRHGFQPGKIKVITQGISLEPISVTDRIKKFDKPTVLSLGGIRPMKRTIEAIRAFEEAKRFVPDLELVVAGEAVGGYGRRTLQKIRSSKYADSIRFLGRVDEVGKQEIMQRSHVLCLSSVKEGWGLTVTEANSQGTPAVVYNVDGLRDSVQNGVTGRVCEVNSPTCMARHIIELVENPKEYQRLQENALEDSRKHNFDNSFYDISDIINSYVQAAGIGDNTEQKRKREYQQSAFRPGASELPRS